MIVSTKPNIGRRILATIIDYGATLMISLIYMRHFGEYDQVENSYSVHGFKTLPLIVYWFVYHVLIENLTGYTLGHFLADLKIVDMNGDQPRLSQNFKRHILDFFDIFMWGIPAIISIKNTDKNQRLGDLWAKTLVIRPDEKTTGNKM